MVTRNPEREIKDLLGLPVRSTVELGVFCDFRKLNLGFHLRGRVFGFRV